jgi:hypothetical protein
MALYQTDFTNDALNLDYKGAIAGNPGEMETKLTAIIAAAAAQLIPVLSIVDLTLGGAGAGPNWESWVVFTSNEDLGIFLPATAAAVAAAVASSPEELRVKLRARLASVTPTPANLYIMVFAGAGLGTDYMGIALYSLGE